MIARLQNLIVCVGMTGTEKSVIAQFLTLKKNNPINRKRLPPGTSKQGNSPRDYWKIDFSEVPIQNGYRHLLILVDTFSGWLEVFPRCTNKAREVTKLLLKEIIPRLRVPTGISSDRGTCFVADLVQQLSKILGIKWDLHIPWRPQSSGNVDRVNQTLKSKLVRYVKKPL